MARSTHSRRRAHAKETFGPLGIEPAGGSPEELKDFIAAEIAKWSAHREGSQH
jgi:hypothetical protein